MIVLRSIIPKGVANRASGGESCAGGMENSSDSNSYDLSTNQRIGVYGGFVFSSVLLIFCRTILSFLICLAAARVLHNKMFKSILRAPILFFDTNPVGMPYLFMFLHHYIALSLHTTTSLHYHYIIVTSFFMSSLHHYYIIIIFIIITPSHHYIITLPSHH